MTAVSRRDHHQAARAGISEDRLFFTNAVLCMKRGGMQARVPASCFRDCREQFLRPMVELVAPRIVVTLGSKAMVAVFAAFGLLSPASLAEAVGKPIHLAHTTSVVPLYHPGRTVLNTVRSLDAQLRISADKRSNKG